MVDMVRANLYQQYAADIAGTLERLPWHRLQELVDLLYDAWLSGRQIFIMGNGGSAATASHMACDLGKNTATPGLPRLRVMSLNDNMALFSANANDNGYENVFAEQLVSLANRGDIVIAISASGNSRNVLQAMQVAQSLGAITVGWSGYEGGALAKLVDLALVVPNQTIEQIEDVHLILEHMVTTALRQTLMNHALAFQVADMQPDMLPAHRVMERVMESAAD